VIRLSTIGQILRKRWRWLLVFGALGAVVGAAASLLWPPTYESSSQVLVLGDPGKDRVSSEAQIAMSTLVLNRAVARLHWGADAARLRDSVTAAVAHGNVIEIKADAGSPNRARQLAEQVTLEYVAFSTEILTKSTGAPGAVLIPRRDALQKQIADMSGRISQLQGTAGLLTAADTQGVAARAEVQQLISNRTEAVNELTDLDRQIVSAQAHAAASQENLSVIEPPLAPPAPVTLTRLQMVASGTALAVVLGAVVVVAVWRADRRLRRGSDIAAALGAPVLETVEAPAETVDRSLTNGASNGHDTGDGRSLLQRLLRHGAPGEVPPITESHDQSSEYLRYRRILARLRGAPEKSVRLLVIVVDDDVLASRAVGRLVIAVAIDGGPVSVMTNSARLAETMNAFLAASHPDPVPINVDVSTSADQSRSSQAAVLRVVAVSAVRPTVPDAQDVSGVLVVTTSGTRTAWELLAVAEACHDAGHSVAGVLMVLPRVEDADTEQLRLGEAVATPLSRADRSPA